MGCEVGGASGEDAELRGSGLLEAASRRATCVVSDVTRPKVRSSTDNHDFALDQVIEERVGGTSVPNLMFQYV